ncbi:MAG: calcium-binding protein [Gemmobacter sp.]
MFGGDGNDNLRGGDDGDEIYGEAGNDSLSGGTGNDLLDGGDGNDTIAGGDDDDLIYGGAGADIITGGKGNDTMEGGPQADRFVFARGHGHDEIVGFQNNTDKLDLSAFGFANAGAVRALAAMRPDGLFIDLSSVGGDSILISSGLRLGQLDAADMVL